MSLSSVYAKTGIPMSDVPANDARQIQATIMATGLTDARSIVLNIRHDYLCQQAFAATAKWEAEKPKPRKVRTRVHGKTVVHTVIPSYRAEAAGTRRTARRQGGPGDRRRHPFGCRGSGRSRHAAADAPRQAQHRAAHAGLRRGRGAGRLRRAPAWA